MNPLAQIVLTVALATGTVAAWHALSDDGGASSAEDVPAVGDRDLAALEARVEALEDRAPLLRGTPDGGQRLLDVEARIRALEAPSPSRGVGRTAGAEASAEETIGEASAPPVPPTDAEVDVALTEAQKRAVQRLVDGAMRERMQGRFSGRTSRVLEELGIELTADQREKLDTAWATHMETVRETFRAGRDAGLDREAIGSQLTALNRKLTETVATFLPVGDAEAVVGALTSRPPGPGPGRGRGDGPR